MQFSQPRRIQHQHRNRAFRHAAAKHVRRISTDAAWRAIRQLNNQHEHAAPPLERPRRQQTPEQRMRLRDNPHIARQDRTQLLQSVAFTPGTGKTHLAVGLARAAAHAGYRTYFTTAADLSARCHRAAIEGRWATTMRFYAGPALLAIDELGYLPLPTEAASALFQVVSQRYLKSSIVLTTNRPVGSWGEILGDTTVAAALLDRLLHRCVVLTTNGTQTVLG